MEVEEEGVVVAVAVAAAAEVMEATEVVLGEVLDLEVVQEVVPEGVPEVVLEVDMDDNLRSF